MVGARLDNVQVPVVSGYDAAAPDFDRHRMLPGGVPEAIRAAVLAAVGTTSRDATSRPHLLDLGAGSGRIGRAFVKARDDYVGADLSLGMLQAFAGRSSRDDPEVPRLLRADGRRLPFRDATFDAVMMIQVFGGAGGGGRGLVGEARRVLRPAGVLVLGRSVGPDNGVDARMKRRLAEILGEMGVRQDHRDGREEAEQQLASTARAENRVIVATWIAERTPRGFLDRHGTGARFSALPADLKERALGRLAVWAVATFGSLDTTCREPNAFELRVFDFDQEAGSRHAGIDR